MTSAGDAEVATHGALTAGLADALADRDRLAAELAAARAEVEKARNGALEEAARIAGRYANRPFDPIDTYGPAIEKTAAVIRRDILKARTTGGTDAGRA